MQVQYHYREVTQSDLPTEVGAEQQVHLLWAVALQFALFFILNCIFWRRNIQQYAISLVMLAIASKWRIRVIFANTGKKF